MNTDAMRKVWQQDDAIPRSHEDYESVWAAYRRITGKSYTESDAEDVFDGGDEFRCLMPDGYVVVVSACAESRIYAPGAT